MKLDITDTPRVVLNYMRCNTCGGNAGDMSHSCEQVFRERRQAERKQDKLHGYMDMCDVASETFPTCAKRRYYAIVLDRGGHVIGTGYNGSPPGSEHCEDGGCPRLREGSAPGSNYDNCVAIHAEANAIIHSDWSQRQDGTIIINGSPCYSCAKLIANSGVSTVVCRDDVTYASWPDTKQSLQEWGIEVVTLG